MAMKTLLSNLPGRLLGIDVGGSSTRAILVADGQVQHRASAPPMNALLTADLAERLLALIEPHAPTAVGVGIPGLPSAADAGLLAENLTRRARCPVYLTGDGKTMWLGAFGGAPGIAVYAGTGSAATGWDGQRWASAGGHGFLLGDEGSAYWLGRAAVNAALRWADGMGGSSAIHRAVRTATGRELDALINDIYAHSFDRTTLATLAPVLTALADEDEAARKIALRAASHLADLATAVRGRLGDLPVCGMGGVLSSPVIWAAFADRTGAVRPLASAEIGAVLLAGAPEAAFIRAAGC